MSLHPIYNIENLINKNKTRNISIYLTIALSTLITIILLPIIEIDISSQSKGIIRSEKENINLNPIVNGKVEKINIENNQSVQKGDTLLIISKDILFSEKNYTDSLLHHAKHEIEDLENLLNGNGELIEDEVFKEEYKKYLEHLKEHKNKVNYAKNIYDRNKILFEKDVISKVEFESYEHDLFVEKQNLKSLIKEQTSDWASKKHEIELKIHDLENKINQITIEEEKYVITAPISGTIENVIGLQIGSFINASQVIAAISPNTNLIVENTVLPSDIGLLKIGQEVKFQMDAFNYNQWGMLSGKIIDIDKNITLQNNTAFFKVRCSIDTKELRLKNGYTTTISKGMTLTSRFYITRRSLYDLLFDKMDDWFNPKILTIQ